MIMMMTTVSPLDSFSSSLCSYLLAPDNYDNNDNGGYDNNDNGGGDYDGGGGDDGGGDF